MDTINKNDKVNHKAYETRRDFLISNFGGYKLETIKKSILEKIRNAKSNEDKEAIIHELYAYIYFGVTQETISVTCSNVKKWLNSDTKKAKDYLRYIKIPNTIYTALKNFGNNQVKEQLSNLKQINIQDYKDFLKSIDEAIKDKNYKSYITENISEERKDIYYKTFYLIAVTGRRFVEILKTISIKTNKNNEFFFDGIAKKKSLNNNDFKAYLLDEDITKLRRYLREVRTFFKTENLTNREISQRYTYIFNQFIKKYIDEKINSSELRKLYAETCYKEFGKGYEKGYFIALCLGHEIQLTQTSHYQKYEDSEK